MDVKTILVVAITLIFSSISQAKTIFPTESDLHGIKDLCGAGSIDSVSAKVQVDAAIQSWKEASAGAEVSAAKKELTGALGNLKDDAHVGEVFKIYVTCVKDTIQQFMDDANKKIADVSAAASATVVRNDYTSDQEAQDVGCELARKKALAQAKDKCGTEISKILVENCPAQAGGVRTYISTLKVKCLESAHVAS
jgi:hypothetical protein